MTATILYARVSTADQTIEHQKAQAEAAGFTIDRVIEDDGISGVNTAFANRPGGSRLLDILRAGDVLVVRWVDRLGRNYQDVTDTIRELMRRGVVVKTVINRMTFDGATTDPIQQAVRDALIGFMAAAAQSQAEATKEAQRAGIKYAKEKAEGERGKYLGRKPSYTRAQLEEVRDMLGRGEGHSAISKATKLTRATIWRIEREPAKAEAALAAWEKAGG
ncbi:recombinase family protein [Inquilinus limosus]|uniref:recombinase family protein n=1 Tax=Inquilinus limosus TaxID=171674 RepID=UPI003F15EC38